MENRTTVEAARTLWPIESFIVPALEGRRLLYMAYDVFDVIDDSVSRILAGTVGAFTPEARLRMDMTVESATYREMFQSLFGPWAQKWVSWGQIIWAFQNRPDLFKQGGLATLALVRKDEFQPVDDNFPEGNLAVTLIGVTSEEKSIYTSLLECDERTWEAKNNFHVLTRCFPF